MDIQTRVLEFIKEHIVAEGYAPTVREISEAVNIKSTSSVHEHLGNLVKKGLIVRKKGSPRAIKVVELKQET